MARIFITGSSDGIGQHLARTLIAQGHSVTLHARSASRGEEAMAAAPGAKGVLIGDLSSIAQTKALAAEANKLGAFESVVHNAGMGYGTERGLAKTEDGMSTLFAVNSLAPYILTVLMERPKHLVYMSSGLHMNGDGSLKDVTWMSGRKWDGSQAYCDSKLHNVMLSFAVARHWPSVTSNSMSPGWVQTKMGGSSASGSMKKAVDLAVRLINVDSKDIGTGKYFTTQDSGNVNSAASDIGKQEEFLKICEELSGVAFPRK